MTLCFSWPKPVLHSIFIQFQIRSNFDFITSEHGNFLSLLPRQGNISLHNFHHILFLDLIYTLIKYDWSNRFSFSISPFTSSLISWTVLVVAIWLLLLSNYTLFTWLLVTTLYIIAIKTNMFNAVVLDLLDASSVTAVSNWQLLVSREPRIDNF